MNRALVCDPVNAIVPKCDAKIRTRDSCGAEFLVLLPFEYCSSQNMLEIQRPDWYGPTVKLLLKSEGKPERRLLLF